MPLNGGVTLSDRIFITIARVVVMLTAMPIHECAHGYAADRLGDDTPRRLGRLSLNPFRHLDLFGSLLLLFTGFGWAKPVLVDPRNFREPKRDMALVSLAGPASNVLLSLAAMVAYKLFLGYMPALRYGVGLYAAEIILISMIYTNLYLAVFNLLPVPPLDGSKIFGAVLPDRLYFSLMRYERYISAILMILIFTRVLSAPLSYLANLLYLLLDLITMPLGRIY